MNESSEMDLFRECENPYWSIISEETLQKLLLIRNNYLLPGKELAEEEYSNHVCIKAILLRVKMGMTNKDIAENLIISVPTVKTHRMRIFKKLGVKTINEALAV